jgi:hypothetical protein
MPMSRHSFPELLRKGVDLVFGMEYKKYSPEWPRVFTVKKADKYKMEEVLISGFGVAQHREEGADVALDQAQEAWIKTYIAQTIALGFEVTTEALDDNLYMAIIRQYAPELANSLHRAHEIRCAQVVNEAFNPAFPGGDGKPLLAVDHPLQRGGTFSNRLAVDADLSEDSLRAILVQMRKNKADNGDFQRLKADKLIIPAEQMFNAHVILKTVQRPGTNDNDINPIHDMGIFTSSPVVMTYLTNSSFWAIQTDVRNGLTVYDRKPVFTRQYVVDRNGNHGILKEQRYSVGFTNPRCLFGSQ